MDRETPDITAAAIAAVEVKLQAAQQEIASLRARVATLEEENLTMRAKLLVESNADDCCSEQNRQQSDLPSRKKQRCQDKSSILSCEEKSSSLAKFRESCDFCNPLRCRTCEKRISTIPSILSLLVKNDFLHAKDLGRLACASATLYRHVCDESDEDIWAHLLFKKWHSTSLMPQTILDGLSHRTWYKRIETAPFPCLIEESVEESDKERRREIRGQLLSIGNGEFPPLPAPSMNARDVMILIDMHDDKGRMLLSSAFRGDEAGSPLLQSQNICSDTDKMPEIATEPLEVELADNGTFDLYESNIRFSVHVIRLEDYRVVCIHDSVTLDSFSSFYDFIPPFPGGDKNIERPEVCVCATLSSYLVGGKPTALTARLGDDDSQYIGFRFEPCSFIIRPPSPPLHYGYKYTVSKYREWLRSNSMADDDNINYHFRLFASEMWKNAKSNPELLPFFKMAEETKSSNGKYLGTIEGCAPPYFDFTAYDHNDREPVLYLRGVTALHAIEELFSLTSA